MMIARHVLFAMCMTVSAAACSSAARKADTPRSSTTVSPTLHCGTGTHLDGNTCVVDEATTPTTQPTTTTLNADAQAFQDIVDKCSIPAKFISGTQAVLDLYGDLSGSSSAADVIPPKYCVLHAVSPGGQAVLGTASGAQGPVTVTEGGLKFTQLYSEIAGQQEDTLIVEAVDGGGATIKPGDDTVPAPTEDSARATDSSPTTATPSTASTSTQPVTTIPPVPVTTAAALPPAPTPTTHPTSQAGTGLPLHWKSLSDFSKGSLVKTVQQRLNYWGYPVDTDGRYGPATKQAVINFQNGQGLTPDGLVGQDTLDLLMLEPPSD